MFIIKLKNRLKKRWASSGQKGGEKVGFWKFLRGQRFVRRCLTSHLAWGQKRFMLFKKYREGIGN